MAVGRIELSARINKKLQLKDRELVDLVVDAMCDEIVEIMYEGKEVRLNNLGRFTSKYKDNMKNPKTLEVLPPMFIPKFSFAAAVRAKIKSKKADYFVNEKKKDNE